MKKYPNVSIKVFIKYKNKILMMRHPNGTNDFPGGQLEFGESIENCLKRELKEELNYDFNIKPELFGVWNYISKDKQRHSILIYYICAINKKPELVSPEKLEVLWLNKKEMKYIISDYAFVERMYLWRKSKKP